MAATWVFGYGSLVSTASLAATLGRPVTPGDGWHEAELAGWGRRWNYGVAHHAGRRTGPDGRDEQVTLVALGVVAADETANGIVVAVSDDELARLDDRERHYDRVDVTDQITIDGPTAGRVVSYVPRPEAVARYERARDAGLAAIEQRYWDLVDTAFAALGTDRWERYRATPAPDVPVLDLPRW